ncbi:MAG: tetratricopeptide repeat protein, partial [Limibaculum sp.]
MPSSETSARRLFNRAERKRAASGFPGAIPLYLEAKRLSPRDKGLKLDCLFALGDTYRMVGGFDRAASNYRQAHRLSLATDDEPRAYDALVGLGLSLRATSDYRQAIRLFNRSLKGYGALKDRAGRAFTLWARAGALRLKGDLKGAIEGFKESRSIFKRLGDRSGVGYCLTGLG